MSNNAPDYENNLFFEPKIPSMPNCDIEYLQDEIEFQEGRIIVLEQQRANLTKNVRLLAKKLLEAKPELEDWIKLNFGEYLEK